jgi:protein TonB
MFDTFLIASGSGKRRLRKALTLSLSLLFHALVIAAVIVVPLLRAEAGLPAITITDAVLIAPPALPGVPPGGRPGRPVKNPGTVKETVKNPGPISGPRTLTAPVEVPATIEDDDPTAGIPGVSGIPGVEGAPQEGTGPWEMGDPIMQDELDVKDGPIIRVTPPRLIKRVSPPYPQLALLARRSGKVVIEASTDISGRVREARVLSGDPLLNDAALEAVRQWLYEPYTVNGIPKPVRFTVTVTFSLENL